MTERKVLAIDIGNTNIVLGVHRGEDLIAYWRMSTSPHRMPDELAVLINSFFTYRGLSFENVDDGIISSVVPPLLPVFQEFCEEYM
ncbi:MAG TPA: type III pantothenate kinase, partial [Anaerolineae bacterium]|nr:type III pantothenate kinase [Anaerolineae bacterium]